MPNKCLNNYTVRKLLPFLFYLFAFSTIASAQAKVKPATPPSANTLQKLLTGTGLPFRVVNDSLAVIPYESENIPSFQVLTQKIGDLYIIYTNLTEAIPGKINDTKFKYLLQQSDHFDIIKIGLSDDNTMYLRADVYRTGITATLLTRIIKQVANVTNIIAGELK